MDSPDDVVLERPAAAAVERAPGGPAPAGPAAYTFRDLLRMVRTARRNRMMAVVCQAALEEAERLTHSGRGRRGRRLCASVQRLAIQARQPGWQAMAWLATAVSHNLDGQHQQAFDSYVGLLRQQQLCMALSPVRHARVYLYLGDLCGLADAETAPLLCVGLGFAALRRRNAEPCGEFWMARAAVLLNLYCMSDGRLQTPFPVTHLPSARRAALLQEAAAAVAQGIRTAERSRLPMLQQRLFVQWCEVQALQKRSTEVLMQGVAEMVSVAGPPRGFSTWWRGILARAALLLDTPELANAILLNDCGSAVPPSHESSNDSGTLFLRASIAKQTGDAAQADALRCRAVLNRAFLDITLPAGAANKSQQWRELLRTLEIRQELP